MPHSSASASAPHSLMTTYRMNLNSVGSISLDSTFHFVRLRMPFLYIFVILSQMYMKITIQLTSSGSGVSLQ
jgi:hypothetical protein